MTEHDYLRLTEKDHRCLLQDTKLKDDKTVIPVPIQSSLHTYVWGSSEAGPPPVIEKRGPEAVFSMHTFVPKPPGYWEELKKKKKEIQK